MNNELTAAIDKLEEFFIWSDDKLALEDKVTELLEFDDDLRYELYNMVIKSIGTGSLKAVHTDMVYNQVQKTIKKYTEQEQE